MPSLVLELQQNALDDDVPVSSLLRKAVAVASKLGVTDADQWLTAELNGYAKDQPVPEYRMVNATRRAKNPYVGFIPVFGPGGAPQRLPIREPVASIEDVTRREEGEAMIAADPVKVDFGMFESFWVLNRTALRAIGERVRNAILEWALALEKKNILGDGLTFRPEEIEAAKTIQHITVFTGPISGGAIVQNVGEGNATAEMGPKLGEVAQLVHAVRERVPSLGLQQEQQAELTAALQRLGEAATEKKPSKSKLLAGLRVVNELLKSAKTAVDLHKPLYDLIEWASRMM